MSNFGPVSKLPFVLIEPWQLNLRPRQSMKVALVTLGDASWFLFNLSVAFDMLSFGIPPAHLLENGVGGIVLQWFFFLRGHSSWWSEKKKSAQGLVLCGVPQGSLQSFPNICMKPME